MSFEKNFCASPWFHMRITSTGDFEFCRWMNKHSSRIESKISAQLPIFFFQQQMADIRKSMLNAEPLAACQDCHAMEQHGKVSGRQRQLLKIGVDTSNFDKSMLSSPWINEFEKTYQQDGFTNQWPQDWQIDLGNYCNSACVFCSPNSSSRLASEFKKLGLIQNLPSRSWCDDENSVARFIDVLKQSPKLTYLHFIGGETLITPAFAKILAALIDANLHQQVSIGFTTNLTTWDDKVTEMLKLFKEINLGMSIECLHPLNDYVRYGSTLSATMNILESWLTVAKQHAWLVQLRITPTALSIWHLDTIYHYALKNGLAVESCNFLTNPIFMRPSVLPRQLRNIIIGRLRSFLDMTGNSTQAPVINFRDPNHYRMHICQDIQSYIHYLEHSADESFRLPDLVQYLKLLESSRGNCVLDYLPEYEELFRSAGY